jgi:Protein of unknown function (DUF3109)
MFVKNFVSIDDVVVRNEIVEKKFECDLSKCKGACCTFKSSYGAPLLEEEVDIIGKILPVVKSYLPEEHLDRIEKSNFYEVKEGEIYTNSYNNRACVFVYYDGSIAKCGIEKAYLNGETNFRKPISCHLFPIRVSRFGGEVLRFEKFSGCDSALDTGEKNNTKLIDFCNEPLKRKFGLKWFLKLKELSED